MEAERPMDRLVAGDVGYGKTEVALRAVFKAVADGAQAAILVPTTVLAQQHRSTFSDRFGPFPARVELLSRFRSPREQKAIVEGLRQGTVDVVIGTHRLLSKDVAFRGSAPGGGRGAPLWRRGEGADQAAPRLGSTCCR